MNKRHYSTATTSVANPPPAASTHDLKAGELAALQAKAVAALVLFAAMVAVAGWGWSETGKASVMAAAIVGLPALAYGISAWRDTSAERRRFYVYTAETRDGRDYNSDSYIGDPFNNIRVPGKNGAVDEVITIPKPSSSARNQPIMQGWGVSAADLVAFVFEVETARGLQERAWVGKDVDEFVLPSGKAITQKLLRELQKALEEHSMASKPDGKWRLDLTAQEIADHLAKSLK